MKRSMIMLQLFALLVLAIAVPRKSFAETAVNCTDQYTRCINDASEYNGYPVLQSMAEAECGMEYTGCVARKLRFW